MTLKPLAIRIPEEIEKEILEVAEREKLDKATVVRTLLEMGIMEWTKQTTLELLRDGKIAGKEQTCSFCFSQTTQKYSFPERIRE